MTATAVPEQEQISARAARAQAILARAEDRTGTSRWVRPVRLEPVGDHADVSGGHAVAPEPRAHEQVLPVAGWLAGLLPSHGLDRGTTLVVSGSTSLVLGLLAEASRTGSWVAVVGMPAVGVLAAAQIGLELERLVLVPAPGPDAALAVGALLDGMDVVVVGPQAALGDADRRRLSARARERSRVLLSTAPWPGASVVLTAGTSQWEGLERGHGRLRGRRLWVQRDGRGGAAQARPVELVVPLARRAG